MTLSRSEESGYKLLAKLLRQNRVEISRQFFAAVRQKECATWTTPLEFDHLEDWGRAQLATAVDLLSAWFETKDPMYRELFAGWVHLRLAADLCEEGLPRDYKSYKAVELVKPLLITALRSHAPVRAIEILAADLDRIAALLPKDPSKDLRVLFIGDCIQSEIMAALACPCARSQINIKSTLIVERVQAALRNRIRALASNEFDLVFFSPFSHSFLPEYGSLLKPKSSLWSKARVAEHVDGLLKEVYSTLDVLAQHFECPVYVHNTAGTIQSFGTFSGLAKNLASLRNRSRARVRINDALAAFLSGAQRTSRLQLLDEDALRSEHSALELGRVCFDSYAFHPTRLGVGLGSKLYFDAVYTASFLAKKKVVVCDLDNTLWDGVIGEGAVSHHVERQAILKELRRRGVLLSINSKNDPKNVHWSGAVLQPDDFVAPKINWNPKTANMAGIRDDLNLKLKDFVFIDDRPDELERMQNAFPEILVLNATRPSTWRYLAQWQNILPPTPEEDRTKLYHERVKREEFVNGLQGSLALEDQTSAIAALKISVKLEEPSRSGLKRAAELINRTNQFNLCGNRTTVRELEDGVRMGHKVIVVSAEDKFGTMGVVGVMRVDLEPHGIEIPIFVLSCRAFGFGIEYALLNSVKSLAASDCPLIGLYKETQFNEPCRRLYPESGLTWDGQKWIGRVGELRPNPAWLTIDNRVAPRTSAVAGSVQIATLSNPGSPVSAGSCRLE